MTRKTPIHHFGSVEIGPVKGRCPTSMDAQLVVLPMVLRRCAGLILQGVSLTLAPPDHEPEVFHRAWFGLPFAVVVIHPAHDQLDRSLKLLIISVVWTSLANNKWSRTAKVDLVSHWVSCYPAKVSDASRRSFRSAGCGYGAPTVLSRCVRSRGFGSLRSPPVIQQLYS